MAFCALSVTLSRALGLVCARLCLDVDTIHQHAKGQKRPSHGYANKVFRL